MFSHIKSRHQQSSLAKNVIFSLVLIPTVIASSEIGTYAYSAKLSNTQAKTSYSTLAQNITAFRLASFWQRKPKQPKVVRGGDICPISPGLADTYMIWNSRPLFLWQNRSENKEAELLIRDRATKEIVWKQSVKTADGKAAYSGTTALTPSKTYEWKLSGTDDDWKIFQIMSTEEQNKISTELQQLEQKLQASKASPEEITQQKAEYFSNYQVKHKTETGILHPWSDVLQTLYEIEQPSAQFVEQRSKYLVNFCNSETPSASVSN
ncbi:hypothetical protein [Calothrix sp. PCC 6303]|uniref:hypothetical protein n=1 Tax=Calothrix sp. PCC 6303 TaxID=1170562 RepID=UPI0002A05215|nr:hypothetical protein [Calothrix sp. PCC 6303]AFZ03966.1 hypothetical protein Cal6303_5077 [Calothrix sp. PCC 6303]